LHLLWGYKRLEILGSYHSPPRMQQYGVNVDKKVKPLEENITADRKKDWSHKTKHKCYWREGIYDELQVLVYSKYGVTLLMFNHLDLVSP